MNKVQKNISRRIFKYIHIYVHFWPINFKYFYGLGASTVLPVHIVVPYFDHNVSKLGVFFT